MSGCKHEHGDQIKYLGWVCGKCYKVLEHRPRKYGMVPTTGISDHVYKGYRQEIIWQASISECEGVTLSTFVKWCAQRFMRRGGLTEEDGYMLALEGLRNMEEEFGTEGICWDRGGAIDLADEEMSYWDHDEPHGDNR